MKVVQVFILLTCLLVEVVAAQEKTITSGTGEPQSHSPWYDFYLDTQHHRAYSHQPGMHGDPYWSLITDDDVLTLDVCNEMVICFDGDGYHAFGNSYALGFMSYKGYRCADSLVWLWNREIVRVLDSGGNELNEMFGEKSLGCISKGSVADTVGGKLVFCVLSNKLSRYAGPCEDLRAWGMMGLDLQWVIEPKYDEPFNFYNGVAEVVLYGKRLRIDEKGERVE
ncbi:MAG: WG repeat-containing protein [Bacteroidia bacterium]